MNSYQPLELDRSEEQLDALVALGRDTEPSFHTTGEGAYRLLLPECDTTFEVDHLRREGGQLKGELLVRCHLSGARTHDGILTVCDTNLSSSRTRASLAKALAQLARTDDSVDWHAHIERFSVSVLTAEREGSPAVWLDEEPEPEDDPILWVEGFPLLAEHPLILFGDGGTAKSILALWIVGKLAEQGHRVGYFDWELDPREHRRRLGRLFPDRLPRIAYCRCVRPFVNEADGLRRMVREHRLDYVVLDSIAFACDGPPEAAEVGSRYFQALRSLGRVGSLHVAHVTKSFETGDQKPFGSVFWHNGARSTWNIKLAAGEPGDGVLHVALHHRKANTTRKERSRGFRVAFEGNTRVHVSRVDPSEVPDLASQLSVPERLNAALRRGPLTRGALQDELGDVKPSTLRQAIHRATKKGKVLEFPDGRLSLVERGRT